MTGASGKRLDNWLLIMIEVGSKVYASAEAQRHWVWNRKRTPGYAVVEAIKHWPNGDVVARVRWIDRKKVECYLIDDLVLFERRRPKPWTDDMIQMLEDLAV